MSLDWNIRQVADFQELVDSDMEQAITQGVVFMTVAVGLGGITEANEDEFVRRMVIVQALTGAYLTINGEPFYLTRAHVHRRIGLRTNVSDESKTVFAKRWLNDVRDIERQQQYRNDRLEQELDKEEAS